MASAGKKRRYPTASSPNESEDDNGEHSTSQSTTKRRGSVAADFAPPRLIVSERQQMAVLKQLTAGEESNTGSQSPSSSTVPQTRPSKIHRRNEHGETIVHIAARKGDLKQLRKVLKAGANVNEADNAGWTPLHEAVTKNQFQAARLLLKSGANANAPGPEGQTPLVDAVLNNNTKMAELLLNFSADPSVVDMNRSSETMSKVLKRELSVLDSSDNENNDEDSPSPLSPLTSENDFEHDEEKTSDERPQVTSELGDANLSPRSAQNQRKKPYHRFHDRSSHSSDSSSQSKTRTTSGNPESTSSSSSSTTMITNPPNKNPYDFESEEEGEIREPTNETNDDQQMKKKTGRKTEHSKTRTTSGGSSSTPSENNLAPKKRFNRFDEEQIHRVPPLKIVLARAVVQRPNDLDSFNSPSMMDETASLTIDSTEKHDEEEEAKSPSNSTSITTTPPTTTTTSATNIDDDNAIISALIQQMIDEIESTVDSNVISVLPIIEDDQMEMDDEGDEEDDDDERKKSDQNAPMSEKSSKNDSKDEISKSTSRKDLKPTTRTLRSHARGKSSLSTSMTNPSHENNHGRRVSSRRRALEAKSFILTGERERKRRTISERSRREKDSNLNDDFHTSSNSDDQTTEYSNLEKMGQQSNSNHGNTNDDASSCSSTGAGEGSSTSSSTNITKPSSSSIADLDTLPPNKRRLRDRNAAINNNNNNNTNIDVQNNSNSETSPIDSQNSTTTMTTTTTTMISKELPVNGIRQFLEIRQQIDKRHENMLNEFVMPRVPKDFAETTMAKKNYLISSSCSPASMGIRRLNPPHDLDPHLMEVFTKQEDERYKMKLRHQVERDKLILSHEQEVLRLYGNATRSSMNQEIPFSYCSLLKDNEVYNNPSIVLPEKERLPPMINADGTTTSDLGKRGKNRWNGRSFIKWLEDSNLKYKRLSCELNERQRLESETLYSMQRMVWLKHLPKESPNLSTSGRTSYFLSERYLPKVEINPNFWTQWETTPF